jgi:hypothetical protein
MTVGTVPDVASVGLVRAFCLGLYSIR